MPDVKFDIKRVYKKCSSFAAKIAVLWPLFGRRSLKDAQVVRDTKKLTTIWRNKLCDLKGAGLPALVGIGRLQYARNCPLCGVVALCPRVLQCCHLRNICPWCWMRRTIFVYNTFANLLPEHGRLSKSYLRLVEVYAHMRMSRKDAGAYLDNHLMRWSMCPKKMLRAMAYRDANGKRVGPLGAFQSIVLAPTAVERQKAAWSFAYRILALVPPEWVTPPALVNPRYKVRVTDVHSKADLVNPVGRTCRYPVGLIRGDLKMTVTALNARRNRRCSEFTGCFRRGKNDRNVNRVEQEGRIEAPTTSG